MRKKFLILITLLFLLNIPLNAKTMNYSIGIYGGFMPSLGGNLDSYVQQEYFNSNSGIDGMNRSMTGYDTSEIDRLFGICGGLEIKAILSDFFLFRIASNYCKAVFDGEGKTVFTTDSTNYYLLECDYSYKEYDFPVTIGLAIPFWKDMMLSLSGGIAFTRAEYKNKFKSNTYPDPFERKGKFKTWGYPLVILMQGEYFIYRYASLTSSISYYHGSSKLIRDSSKQDFIGFDGNGTVDFAKIDFSGYKLTFGVSVYIFSI